MSIELTSDIGKNFCYAPWTNIHINTLGHYKMCCAGTIYDNLRDVPIVQALSRPEINDIKQALLNNVSHSHCTNCTTQEFHSGESERKWYSNIAENKVIKIDDINDQVIQNLDIRWNNTCNLSCVYCGHEASSVWATLKGVSRPRTDYGENLVSLLEFIAKHKSTIRNLALLGGEPLLQKENEMLLEQLNTDVHINVITNLNVPLEKNKIFNQLLEMDNVTWDVSFETFGDRFEYIRHGASWELMLKNMKILQDAIADKVGHTTHITGQYCVYNCLNLSEVYDTFKQLNLPLMRLNELTHPSILNVFTLPKQLLEIAKQEVIQSLKYVRTSPNIARFLQGQYNTLNSIINHPISNTEVDIEKLYQFHKEQEQTYWSDTTLTFERLWPEFRV